MPERMLSDALFRLRMPHVLNDKSLPGTPDIAIYRLRVAVFVHGCFWHGCPEHYRAPKTRAAFWAAKLQRTKTRDRRATAALRSLKWRVVTIWEHEVRQDPDKAARHVAKSEDLQIAYPGKGRTRSPLQRLRTLSSTEICQNVHMRRLLGR